MKELNSSIDSLGYHSLVGRKGLPNIPDLNGMTTATIEQHYSWLGINWDRASNTSLKDGTPYYRTYTNLVRPPALLDRPSTSLPDIEEIDLGFFDPDLGGQLFYRLTHPFFEDTYTSSADFYRWEYERFKYLHEILYHNRISSTKRWDRPLLNPPPAEPDPNTPPKPPLYRDITTELLDINIEPNKAWGIKLSSDLEFDVLVDGIPAHTSVTTIKLSPLLSNSITVRFTNISNQLIPVPPPVVGATPPDGSSSSSNLDSPEYLVDDSLLLPRVINPKPTYLRVDLYGEELARHFYHVGGELEDQQATLLHKVDTPFTSRLLPPNKEGPNFPKEFWNYRSFVPPVLAEYYERENKDLTITVLT